MITTFRNLIDDKTCDFQCFDFLREFLLGHFTHVRFVV